MRNDQININAIIYRKGTSSIDEGILVFLPLPLRVNKHLHPQYFNQINGMFSPKIFISTLNWQIYLQLRAFLTILFLLVLLLTLLLLLLLVVMLSLLMTLLVSASSLWYAFWMTWVTTFILPIVSASEISIYSVIGNVSSTQVPLIGIIEKVKNA